MAEVPRIVRERLRGQVASGEHPDANLLSGFAERSLTETERAQVLDHLSRCADCRDVVALSAMPPVEEEQLVAAAAAARSSAASRSWWRSPVIHWGALTAAALVVLIAVGERMRPRQEYSASAPAIASHETAQKQAAPEPALAQPPAPPKESQKVADAAQAPRRAEAVNRPPAAGVSGGRIAGNAVVRAGSAGKPAAPPPPPPPETKKLQSSNATDFGEGQPYDKLRKFDQPQSKALPAPSAKAAPGAARPGGVVASSPLSAPTNESVIVAQSSAGNLVRRAFVGPRWSVSDAGAVQRSFNGGQSWKEVAVAEGVSFRAVMAVVNDIWAGGSGGALFHSTDGGEHWTRVQVQANDRTLSGDIIRIEVADVKNLVVTTSAGETWTTSDAGASWRPQ